MTTARRSTLWPVILIAVGSIWLLTVAGAFPLAVEDILLRAWPALLVLFGFDVLVGRRQVRVSRWTLNLSWVGLVLLVIVLAGVVWFAYQKQAGTLRSDNQVSFAESISTEINQIILDVSVERTTVTVAPAEGAVRDLSADFQGSNESDVTMVWVVDGDTATLTVTESYPNAIPKLEDYGRGTLAIALPVDVPVQQFLFDGSQGDLTLNIQPLRLERLDVHLADGDITVALPAQDVLTGIIEARSGDLDLQVPRALALTLSLEDGSGEPSYEYDSFRYDLLRNGTLKLKNVDAFQIGLTVWLKGGARLRVVDVE
ncbi:MAG: hypothetical protein JXQ72_09700 [Anaerolineae bacterium]|nr:hypothetical protein [Anaerolineae bacterium]